MKVEKLLYKYLKCNNKGKLVQWIKYLRILNKMSSQYIIFLYKSTFFLFYCIFYFLKTALKRFLSVVNIKTICLRSSHLEQFWKKLAVRNIGKSVEKYLWKGTFFGKPTG